MSDLSNFTPEVREAIEQFDCVTMHGDKWKVIRAELIRLAQPAARGEPVAYLHQVVQDDGEPDQALSFYPDNFPLQGVCGFRSIGHRPLVYGDIQPATRVFFDPALLTKDSNGWYDHPDVGLHIWYNGNPADEAPLDEARFDELGLDLAFVLAESDPDFDGDAYYEGGNAHPNWEPEPPEGEGWRLCASYDTENGPAAFFVRDKVDAIPLTAQPVEMSPEFTDSARAAIAWVLYHHQGGNSAVGQPLRFALGMGAHEPLQEWRIAEAKKWATQVRATTDEFHTAKQAGVPDGYVKCATPGCETMFGGYGYGEWPKVCPDCQNAASPALAKQEDGFDLPSLFVERVTSEPSDEPPVMGAGPINQVVGHKTHWSKERGFWHTPLYADEAAELMRHCEAEDARRAALIPDEAAGIRLFFDAWLRLKEFGWKEAIYCPKDGSEFLVIEPGSTGQHPCIYEGEWPDGRWWITSDGDMSPSRPVLFKPKPLAAAPTQSKEDA